jgi:hypothetical protein
MDIRYGFKELDLSGHVVNISAQCQENMVVEIEIEDIEVAGRKSVIVGKLQLV